MESSPPRSIAVGTEPATESQPTSGSGKTMRCGQTKSVRAPATPSGGLPSSGVRRCRAGSTAGCESSIGWWLASGEGFDQSAGCYLTNSGGSSGSWAGLARQATATRASTVRASPVASVCSVHDLHSMEAESISSLNGRSRTLPSQRENFLLPMKVKEKNRKFFESFRGI